MDFLSRDKSPSYVYRHGHPRMVDGAGNVTQAARHSAIIKFEPAVNPYPTKKLSGKDNLAHGLLWVKKVVQHFRQIGYDDIDRNDIINFLMTHPEHGREFAWVGSDLDGVVNYLVKEPDNSGDYYCSLCDKHNIAARGKAGHEKSNRHQELLKAEQAAAVEMFSEGGVLPETEGATLVPEVSA